jgi:superoxide dismutase, Cu-Zn family
MKPIVLITVALAVALAGTYAQSHDAKKSESKTTDHAICVMYPTLGNNVTGIIHFTRVEGGVKILADIQNLTKGKHGFHIHEFGDCSALDGNSAGGHFNPAEKSHGAPADENRHIGDLGNIEADASGKGILEYVDKTLTLDGPNSIIGRSVIIHVNEDDLKTQPTGNAGARLACGVIGVAK